MYILSFFLMLGVLFAAGQHRLTAYAAGNDRIYYFNMDSNGLEGNMILVESDGHWGLMDAGHRYARTITDSNGAVYSTTVNGLSSQIYCRNGRDVANYMVNVLGVTHLDFIIGTHAHSDHVGGIPEIATTAFQDAVGNTHYLVDDNTTYYYKKYEHISDLEDDLNIYSSSSWHNQAFAFQAAETMRTQGAKLINVADGRVVTEADQANFSDYVEFKVGNMTFRLYNLDEQTYSGNENVNSIVTVISNGEHTVVNLADINTNNGAIDRVSEAIARDIANTPQMAPVDIVVAGHHGYAGSNTKTMFDELQPQIVVVSNGMGNSWLYSDGDLAAAIPYAEGLFGTLFYNLSISQHAVVTDLNGDSVYVYSLESNGDLTNAINRMMKSSNRTGWASWVNTDGTLWSYLEKGKTIKNDWRQVNRKWYHFDGTGIMQTGWITTGGNQYFLDESGAAVSGWMEQDGNWYYLNPNRSGFGKALTGWQNIGGKRYCFNGDGVMLKNVWQDNLYLTDSGAVATGWLELDGFYYYLEPNSRSRSFGKMTTGWRTISNKRYCFDDSGRMLSNEWYDGYYLKSDGAMASGWMEQDGNWYYMNPNSRSRGYGKVMTGWQSIGGKRYCFNGDGVMLKNVWQDGFYLTDSGAIATGWLELDGFRYYLEPNSRSKSYGKIVTGWQIIGGNWYYFDESGRMVTGAWIEGYYLSADGSMATGLQTIDGITYYMNAKGEKQTGWQQVRGKWYYFDENGCALKGTWTEDGYYLTEDGSMATGLQTIDGVTYYMNAKGEKQTDWQQVGGKWYFFDDSGRMLSNEWYDGYYLTADGSMATGMQVIDGVSYYLDASGHPQGGWHEGHYFDSDGILMTNSWTPDSHYVTGDGTMASSGWLQIGDSWYFFNADGSRATGWLYLDSSTYYFAPDGVMAVGEQVIGGVTYNFADDGRMIVAAPEESGYADENNRDHDEDETGNEEQNDGDAA